MPCQLQDTSRIQVIVLAHHPAELQGHDTFCKDLAKHRPGFAFWTVRFTLKGNAAQVKASIALTPPGLYRSHHMFVHCSDANS